LQPPPSVATQLGRLAKIKTDSEGNVHYEKWRHPSGDRTVLTKPKILTIAFEWAQRTDALCDACD